MDPQWIRLATVSKCIWGALTPQPETLAHTTATEAAIPNAIKLALLAVARGHEDGAAREDAPLPHMLTDVEDVSNQGIPRAGRYMSTTSCVSCTREFSCIP